MATVSINLSTTEYVQINSGFESMVMQSDGDAVRVVVSVVKPSTANKVFHILYGKHHTLKFDSVDTDVWAIATSSASRLIVTQLLTPTIPGAPAAGTDLNVSAWGLPKIAIDDAVFDAGFTFDVSSSDWIIEENNVEVSNSLSTRAAAPSGYLDLRSGVVDGDSTFIIGRRHAPYQMDTGLKGAVSVAFIDAAADGVLEAGLMTIENGAYFRTRGDSLLYAVIMSDGVVTIEELITVPFAYDVTKMNNYEIQIHGNGGGIIRFYITDSASMYPTLVHTINRINQLAGGLLIRDLNLPIGMRASNVTREVRLEASYTSVLIEGGFNERFQWNNFSIDTVINTGQPVLVLKQPLLADNGRVNTKDLSMERLTVGVSSFGTASLSLYITRDPTAFSGGAFVVPKPGRSLVEFNSTVTGFDLAKLFPVFNFSTLAASVAVRDKPNDDFEYHLVRGDYLVMICDTANGVNANLSIEWGE